MAVGIEILTKAGELGLCSTCHKVLEVLCSETDSDSIHVASNAGFRNRVNLARHLAKNGLPPVSERRDWIRALEWLEEWEAMHHSLSRQAYDHEKEPSVYYRTIVRITGLPWRRVKELGLRDLVRRFESVLANNRCSDGGPRGGTGSLNQLPEPRAIGPP